MPRRGEEGSLRTPPPSGLSNSFRLTGCGWYVPLSNCSRMAGQCCFRCPVNSWTVMPSTPAIPLLRLTRAKACLKFSRAQTSSIIGSPMAGLSAFRFAVNDSVPSPEAVGASLLLSSRKANTSWFFCRLSPMSRAAYSPLPLTLGGGPFGPSAVPCRLTSAARSGSITRPSVPFSRQAADLPR